MNLLHLLFGPVIVAAVVAQVCSQLIKQIITFARRMPGAKTALLKYGGFPSSHSAAVMGATAMIVLRYGWDAPAASVSLLLAMIVASDILRERGVLVEVYNEYIERNEIDNPRQLGAHTMLDILAGWGIGILVAWLIHKSM